MIDRLALPSACVQFRLGVGCLCLRDFFPPDPRFGVRSVRMPEPVGAASMQLGGQSCQGFTPMTIDMAACMYTLVPHKVSNL